MIKIKNLISKNIEKFSDNKINETITSSSKPEEIKSFFEKCIHFKGDLKGLDGKSFLELNEEGIEKFGLNLGQKKN